jgi:hypothetical protein
LRNRDFPFQVRQSAERLGGHERCPLVLSNFEQTGPLRRTKLLQKVRLEPGLLAHEQKHGDRPPRDNLAGIEYFDAFILQQIQQFVFLIEVHAHPVHSMMAPVRQWFNATTGSTLAPRSR